MLMTSTLTITPFASAQNSNRVTVPAGTQSNKFMRLGGKGMPKLKSDAHGDEYVRLIGTLPTNLSDKEQKLFRELSALRNGKK